MTDRQRTGRQGENAVARHLEKQDFRTNIAIQLRLLLETDT